PRAGSNHDRHREREGRPLAPAIRSALGHSVQLLRERPALGPHVRPPLSILSVLRPRLPQPAPLAGESAAGRGHRLPAMLQRLPDVRTAAPAPRTGRLPDARRSGALWAEMAYSLHAVLHRRRATTRRLPAPFVLFPGRVLRQPGLPSAGGSR